MKTFRHAMFIGGALLASATVSEAQGRIGTTTSGRAGGTMSPTASASSRSIPSGMCQVWINGLPANRQPAPTDCATARRQAPANSRVIYGSGTTSGSVYYPNGQYDPRYDPRSPKYDPRTAQQRSGQYGGQAYSGERGRDNREWKAEKEREKYERKQQKEREKAWKKAHKGNGRHGDDDDDDHHDADHDDDDHHDGDHRDGDHRDDGRWDGRGGRTSNIPRVGTVIPRTTTTSRTCVDANRDGVCDIMQTARGSSRP